MQRCFAFGSGDFTPGSDHQVAIMADAARALGYEVIGNRPNAYHDSDFTRCDLALLFGFRNRLRQIAAQHIAAGIPTIIFDLGYFYRDRYYQLGLGGINTLPPDAPDDRWRSLSIELKTRKKIKRDKVLVASQKYDDAQHSMTEDEVKAWAQDACDRVIDEGFEPILRQHPKNPRYFTIEGVTDITGQSMVDWWDQIHALVTYNSTMGLEALVEGVPVFCNPLAHYAEVANTDLDQLGTPRLPSKSRLEKFLSRVAYNQWNVEELRSGTALKFVLDRWEKEHGQRIV